MTLEKLESFIGLALIAEKGTRVDRWLNHFKLTTKAIVRQYLKYYDLVHIPLAEFSVDAIAKQLNISYSQLNRISAELFGRPLKQYVLEVKVTAAADMLRKHPELSVAGVAARVGIDNANYFSKVFQKHMGCRCSEYRKNIYKGFLTNFPTKDMSLVKSDYSPIQAKYQHEFLKMEDSDMKHGSYMCFILISDVIKYR